MLWDGDAVVVGVGSAAKLFHNVIVIMVVGRREVTMIIWVVMRLKG
jgi:hypothetical protein